MGFFVVLEGIDGAGKTTLAKKLAKDLKAQYITTPPDILGKEEIRKIMDNNVEAHTRFLYYLLCNSYVSDKIRKLSSQNFICDRYIHSTLSIHSILNGIEFEINQFNFAKPDLNIFLYTSEEERRKRIEKRGKNTKYDKIKENDKFREKYISYFKERNFTFVDTSNEIIEESFLKIKKAILKMVF